MIEPRSSDPAVVILTISYEQTIHAYPGGGGAYIVARDNLGELPAQTAAAALLTDYILTVAVSISSGVAQITSAFPALYPYRVEISVALVFFVMLVNLRGVKESGAIFAAPTYFFIIGMFIEEISAQRQPNEIITVVVPQFVPKKQWHNLLHTQTALFLRMALLFKPGIVITDVPYQLH